MAPGKYHMNLSFQNLSFNVTATAIFKKFRSFQGLVLTNPYILQKKKVSLQRN